MRVALSRMAAKLAARAPAPPGAVALSRERRSVAEGLLTEHKARIEGVKKLCSAEASLAPESPAGRALAELSEVLIRRMRSAVHGEGGALARAFSAIDARLPSDAEEHMDAPSFDEARRRRMLRTIDRYAQAIGSYARFYETLTPLLRTDGSATTIVDLASGHGGFPVALSQMSRGKAPVVITATDTRPEYLSLGSARADVLRLDNVSFRPLDALRLDSAYAPGEVDIVTCTQSLHHFGAGGTALLMAQAVRASGRGALLIDLCRSASLLTASGAASLLTTFDAAFVHDATLSVRRSFVPEELSLLAGLIPNGETLEIGYLAPGFVFARSRAPSQATRGET